jgi:hypothetical protein
MVGRTTPRGRSCWPRTSLNCYWLQPMLTGTPGRAHVGAWPARTEPAPVPRAPASACGPAHPRGRRTRRARRRPADGAPRRRRTQASLVRPVHAAGQRSARAARRGATTAPARPGSGAAPAATRPSYRGLQATCRMGCLLLQRPYSPYPCRVLGTAAGPVRRQPARAFWILQPSRGIGLHRRWNRCGSRGGRSAARGAGRSVCGRTAFTAGLVACGSRGAPVGDGTRAGRCPRSGRHGHGA